MTARSPNEPRATVSSWGWLRGRPASQRDLGGDVREIAGDRLTQRVGLRPQQAHGRLEQDAVAQHALAVGLERVVLDQHRGQVARVATDAAVLVGGMHELERELTLLLEQGGLYA